MRKHCFAAATCANETGMCTQCDELMNDHVTNDRLEDWATQVALVVANLKMVISNPSNAHSYIFEQLTVVQQLGLHDLIN